MNRIDNTSEAMITSTDRTKKNSLVSAPQNDTQVLAVASAMKVALKAANVKFFRVCTVDVSGQTRAKALPLSTASPASLMKGPQIVECLMSLPIYGDLLIKETGLTAAGNLCMRPDMATMCVVPYTRSHAMAFGDLVESDGTPSPYCTRTTLKHVLQQAQSHGYTISVGSEIEFVLQQPGSAPTEAESAVDMYNFAMSRGMDDNGAFLEDVHDALSSQDVPVELIHGESASGQYEVVLKHTDALRMADSIIIARETIAAIAKKHGQRATMVPKPYMMQAGNGMHMHFSFSSTDKSHTNLFADVTDRMGVSAEGKSFMAGVVHHIGAISAVTTPSVNSFRRIAPGCWSGGYRGWATENKEAPVRLCNTGSQAAEHFEVKTVDGTCNPYLAMAAIIASGLDGIERHMELPEALPASMSVDEAPDMEPMPASFKDALRELKEDRLIQGVMGNGLFKAYIAVKENELGFFDKLPFEKEVAVMMAKGI